MDPVFELIETRATEAPLLVYIAIGCSQAHYRPGEHSPQEYPPFIRDFAGVDHKIALLIDPALEDPPRALADNPTDTSVTFVPIRARLFWRHTQPSYSENVINGHTLLSALLELRSPPTYIVVQDYTGDDISPFDPGIPGRVLLDATYGDFGCLVDFSKHTHIPRDPVTGAILHLDKHRLQDIPAEFAELRHRLARVRASDLRYYIHRNIRVIRGDTPAADWCSPEEVQRRLTRLAPIYGSTNPSLFWLAEQMLLDFGIPPTHIPTLIADPTGEVLSRALADSPFLR
jgi:hypothetical protein